MAYKVQLVSRSLEFRKQMLISIWQRKEISFLKRFTEIVDKNEGTITKKKCIQTSTNAEIQLVCGNDSELTSNLQDKK